MMVMELAPLEVERGQGELVVELEAAQEAGQVAGEEQAEEQAAAGVNDNHSLGRWWRRRKCRQVGGGRGDDCQ